MANPFTQTREAIWTYINNNAALTAFMPTEGNHKWDLGATSKVPKKITKMDCPLLFVVPSDCPEEWESSVHKLFSFTMTLEGHVCTTDVGVIEEFAWLTYKAVFDGFPSFGLSFVRDWQPTSISFSGYDMDNIWFQMFSFPIKIRIQQNMKP